MFGWFNFHGNLPGNKVPFHNKVVAENIHFVKLILPYFFALSRGVETIRQREAGEEGGVGVQMYLKWKWAHLPLTFFVLLPKLWYISMEVVIVKHTIGLQQLYKCCELLYLLRGLSFINTFSWLQEVFDISCRVRFWSRILFSSYCGEELILFLQKVENSNFLCLPLIFDACLFLLVYDPVFLVLSLFACWLAICWFWLHECL